MPKKEAIDITSLPSCYTEWIGEVDEGGALTITVGVSQMTTDPKKLEALADAAKAAQKMADDYRAGKIALADLKPIELPFDIMDVVPTKCPVQVMEGSEPTPAQGQYRISGTGFYANDVAMNSAEHAPAGMIVMSWRPVTAPSED